MRFQITDDKLKKVVYRYLERDKGMNTILEHDGNYSLCNSEKTMCNIHYEKDDGICNIWEGLIDEVSSFFSIGPNYSAHIIVNYFQDKTGVKIKGWEYMYD